MKTRLAIVTCLALGVSLLFGTPTFLLKAEVLTVGIFALVYGFTAFAPRLPGWTRCPELMGVAMVALGCLALFVPAQFLISALLVGGGARLVMNPGRGRIAATATQCPITRTGGDIVLRESGTLVTRD